MFDRIAQAFDLVLVRGSTRYVFMSDQKVYKLPSFHSWRNFLEGLLANMTEYSFSQLRDPRLCPIESYIPGGFLVVMPRCRQYTREDMDANLYGLQDFWDNGDIDLYSLVEPKPDSFGLYYGKLVAIDYGTHNWVLTNKGKLQMEFLFYSVIISFMLFAMIGAHFLCDFALQGDFMSKAKNIRNPISGVPAKLVLFGHASIHGTAVMVITGLPLLFLVETLLHYLIDTYKQSIDFWSGSGASPFVQGYIRSDGFHTL